MIEIAYYMKNENDKELYWVDIINTKTNGIIAGCGFETVEDAFDYAREYEEDIYCTDYPEEVWEYKLEMTRLCYQMNKNPELLEIYKNELINIELGIVENILGKNKLDEIISEELSYSDIEEIKDLKDIY